MSQDLIDRIPVAQDLLRSYGYIPLPVLIYCALVYSNQDLPVEEIYYQPSDNLINIFTVIDNSSRLHRDFLYGCEWKIGRAFPDILFSFRLLEFTDRLGDTSSLGLPTAFMKPLCMK